MTGTHNQSFDLEGLRWGFVVGAAKEFTAAAGVGFSL